MFLSKIWFFLVALAGVIALTIALVMPRPAQRTLVQEEQQRLVVACGVVDILLADDARKRVELAGQFARKDEIVNALRHTAPERVVETRIQPGMRLSGDPVLMRTALDNLLGNAWKYSSRVEKAVIEVGLRDRVLFVRDNGAGFDMKEAQRLFVPFERLHRAAEFEGTGVGLAAVHRIVERHGGRIWAESEPGRGATFYVDLPEATID